MKIHSHLLLPNIYNTYSLIIFFKDELESRIFKMSRLMIAVYITKTNAKLWAKFVTLKIPLGKVKANFRMRLNENLNSNLFSNKTSRKSYSRIRTRNFVYLVRWPALLKMTKSKIYITFRISSK